MHMVWIVSLYFFLLVIDITEIKEIPLDYQRFDCILKVLSGEFQ